MEETTVHVQEPTRTRRKAAPSSIDAMPLPVAPPARKKVTVELTFETAAKLKLHADRLGLTLSDVMSDLIDTHLKRFVVQDRGAKSEAAA